MNTFSSQQLQALFEKPLNTPKTPQELAVLIGNPKYWQLSETAWHVENDVLIKCLFAQFQAPGQPLHKVMTAVRQTDARFIPERKRWLIELVFCDWQRSFTISYPHHPHLDWHSLQQVIFKGFDLKEDSVCISPEAGTPSEAIASGTSSADANSAN